MEDQDQPSFPVPTLDPRRQTLDIPLVGREAELAQLHSWLGKALTGARQIFFVTGEPGIGKTSLIEAFLFGVRSPELQEENQKAKIKRQKAKIEGSCN